ncbi:hypothetical protein M885DRAFT_563524 [Pelagophyceae sp. CCMP2097]|nr:hypothetical protein M885DRAFT_563524 [Pelagophyceae sp. CCMP2097]
MSDGYNFKKTTIQENKLADWLRVPVTSDLQQIPGIGPAYELKLKEGTGDDVVETCHQLIGKFLSFKGTGVTSKEHCDAVRRPCPDPPPAFFICDSAPAL